MVRPLLMVILLIVAIDVRTAGAQSTPSVVPTVIPLSGQLVTAAGEARRGTVVLVISLYEAKDDPTPRWVEYQVATLDGQGRYQVSFGGTREEGLPSDLFTGPASTRWIGVGIENEPEPPRVMLVSVPYAARAASADMLAGRGATDFVLASEFRDDLRSALEEEGIAVPAVDTVPGTAANTPNYLQKGNTAGTGTDDSAVFEIAGNVGVGTATPMSTLHVLGTIASGNADVARAGFTYEPVGLGTHGKLHLQSNQGAGLVTAMTVDHRGYLGVGTGWPEARLDVAWGGIVTRSGDGPHWTFKTLDNFPLFTISRRPATNNLEIDTSSVNGHVLLSTGSGGVGIGTVNPEARLHVVGSTMITGDVTVMGNIAAKYQDVAEWVESVEPLEPGTVVTIDRAGSNRVKAAAHGYDGGVAGAVSPQPGVTLGEPGPGKLLIAQSGRVRIKADATYGAIRPGDLLVASPTRGHAMRGRGDKVRPGTVIGKALEALPAGRGEILALLTLQ